MQAIPPETSSSTKFNLFKGSQTWVDGDSYVGAWSGGLRSGWGATYWNNGNLHEGNNAADGGVMHGQALHFKWGDGAAFRSDSESVSLHNIIGQILFSDPIGFYSERRLIQRKL